MVKIRKLLEEATRDREALDWEGTFEEYLNMVIADPHLYRFSQARIYDMVHWAGTTPGPDGVPEYKLFSGELFGLQRALDRMVQYFHAAANGLEIRKRILLLMGPPASGKSSIVNLLKLGLERYSRADVGAVYGIAGCPMQEEPLHLIPEERWHNMAHDHGIDIEGDLCPRCRYNVRHEYGGDIAKVKVMRLSFSQSDGVGFGSFVATAPQSQEMSRLIGSVDISYLTEDRLEGAGKGIRLDGELEAANRGIMEFIEIFKSDERFLAVILGVTQEQVIKLGSSGSVYADESIIAHSNEEEYNAFVNNKETAALRDRIILVKIPYVLRVRDEVKIYTKMLSQGRSNSSGESVEHAGIAPLSLTVVAALAVLSRLEVAGMGSGLPRVSPLHKMKLYDDIVLPPYSKEEVEKLQADFPREGMFGLSPRYVINRLADAIARDAGCLTPAKALKSVVDGLPERAGMGRREQDRILGLTQDTLGEYKELAIREVQRAATEDFKGRAAQLFQDYARNAERSISGSEAGATHEVPVDEKLLRRVEGALNLREGERPRFRAEIVQTNGLLEQRLGSSVPSYESIPTLKMAIEDLLFPRRDEVKLMLDPAGHSGRDRIYQRLLSGFGYCEECAQDLVHFTWMTLRGKDVVSVKRGKVSWT